MNCKRRGELSELAFLFKASSLGFSVSKPYGESSRYDFVVEHLGRLSKVQVKSTGFLHPLSHAYEANAQRNTPGAPMLYQPGDLDYFAFYVIPRDAWYIVPPDVVGTLSRVPLYPHAPARDRRFGRYREAWHLLEGFKKSTDVLFTFNIDACEEGKGALEPAFPAATDVQSPDHPINRSPDCSVSPAVGGVQSLDHRVPQSPNGGVIDRLEARC